jgi:hypothetical protein
MVRPRPLTNNPTTLKTGRTLNMGKALALNARQVKQSADVKQAFKGTRIKAGLCEGRAFGQNRDCVVAM